MQLKNIVKWMILALILLTTLVACSLFQATEIPEAEPVRVIDDSMVSVTGIFVPEVFASLSVAAPGMVDEVRVQEGQSVAEGQELIILRGLAQNESVLAAAEFELEAAQQALDDTYTNAELENAAARLALWEARGRLIAAETEWVNLDTDDYQDDIDEAHEDVLEIEEDLEDAQDTFDRYADLDEDSAQRIKYEDELEDAQKAYNEKVRLRDELIIELERAEASWVFALEAVEMAEEDYLATLSGPDPDRLALAEARLASAKAQVNAAQDQKTNNISVLAPFAGTVADLNIHPGEWASPGMPVLLLADLGSFRIETTDLNEIEIVRIEPGDPVEVTFDALPDRVFEGTVSELSPKASAGIGVNYTVIIELIEIPEDARWGMTAFVDIEVGD